MSYYRNMRVVVASVLLFLSNVALMGQFVQVWPGDANDNGAVNNVDFLYLGLGYNYVGPVRPNASNAFTGQPVPIWSFALGPASANSGFNFAYSDCNGDGIINFPNDAIPIYAHYGMTHGTVIPDVFPIGIQGVDAPLYFDLSAQDSVVHPGDTMSLPIHLGTSSLPIQDFYGIAFSIFVDTNWIDLNDAQIVAAPLGTWVNNDGDRITLVYRPANNRLDIAIVRTDHNERSGSGYIGKLDFIIIDDVVGFQEQLQLRIDSIRLIDGVGNVTAVAGDIVNFSIENPVAENPEPAPSPKIEIYPNPAQDVLLLNAHIQSGRMIIYDMWGRRVMDTALNASTQEFRLPPLPNGTYLVELKSEHVVHRQKLQILRE